MAVIPERGDLRTLAAATFANTLGSGLWVAMSAVFLTRSAGLSPAQVGLGFSVGGLVGLLSAVPLGSLADRFDPRAVRALLQLAQAVITAAYVLVHSMPVFLVVVILDTAAATGNLAVRASLVSAVAGPGGRVRAFATLRAVASVAIGIGAGLASLALAADTRGGYVGLVLVDAATFALSAALIMRLPSFPPPPRTVRSRRAEALRDRPFLAVTFVTSLLSMHQIVLSLVVPLWIVGHTHAPRVLVSAVLVTNMALTALLAVRFSRDVDTAAPAATKIRRAGPILALGLVTFSFASGRSAALAILVLLAAAVVYTVGDIIVVNAASGLSYALSKPHLLGQYQGVTTLGTGLAEALGPVCLTVVLLDGGRLGWWLVGLLFVVCGAAVPPLTRWAVSSHTPAAVETRPAAS